jgi:multiple sugar transport system permease protein
MRLSTVANATLSPRHPGSTRSRVAGPRRRTGLAYLFLAPFLILFLIFVVWPALDGIWISLHLWNPLMPNQPFIGLKNYSDLFTPASIYFSDFWQSMGNTGVFVIASVPFLVIISLIVATLLNNKLRGGSIYRAVFFAPYVLGVAVVSVIWKYLLDPQLGVVNHLLGALGLPSNTPWTVDVPWAWISLVGVTVWWTLGFNTVIFLAGLKGINADLYEAAALDGAGPIRKFWSVTLPGLRPVMTFVTTVTILASANMFGQSYLLTQGGPGHATRTAIMYIADEGLSQNQMGAASAMSYVLFAFLAIISVINFRVQRDRSN